MNSLLEEHLDKHYKNLKEPKKLDVIEGIIVLESMEQMSNRLKFELQQIERNGIRDSYVVVFHSYYEKVKSNPSLPPDVKFKYALKEFEKEWCENTPYEEEVKQWCSEPFEDLVSEYAKMLTYRKVLSELFYKHVGFTEPEENEKKEEIKITPRTRKQKVLKLMWNEEDINALIKLYNGLIQKDDPYIIETDFLVFENNFLGKKEKSKIIWNKSLGSLIYMLDNLSDFMDEELYIKGKSKSTIRNFIGNHFVYRKNGKLTEIMPKSIYDARSKFNDSRNDSNENKKNIKKIDTIIQELTD